MLTARRLHVGLGIPLDRAQHLIPYLTLAAQRWNIRSDREVAAWVAQCAHESRLFTRTEESLHYTSPDRLVAVWPGRFRRPVTIGETLVERFEDGKRNAEHFVRHPEKLANAVYSGRMGNVEEGDGWRFRGRGYIQLTGRDNYSAYEEDSGVPVVGNPALLEVPQYAADSAGWYWDRIGGNRYVREADFSGLTRAINGGLHGLEERERAMRALLDG